MSIIKELKVASVVIVARNFNPSIFSQQWLLEKRVIGANPGDGQQIFTPQFVHVTDRNFRLTVLPEQLVFEVVSLAKETFVSLVDEKLLPVITALKETPFAAVGVNFQWNVIDSEQNIANLSKRLFDKGEGVFSEFNTADARYGAYMSKDFLDVRLKLDIKPVNEGQGNDMPIQEFIMPAFNFHRDLSSSDKSTELVGIINNCREFLEESEKIVDIL